VSPEVVKKKLLALAIYLDDLRVHENSTFEEFMKKHYEIERLVELLLMTASDIIFHLLSDRGEPIPGSYRAAFLRAGEVGILSPELGASLARSAGLRNILVHEYQEIDYRLLQRSVPAAIRDLTAFIQELSA
jgi:uncharacterized protein YutE (UPF0331/DUF86 family)